MADKKTRRMPSIGVWLILGLLVLAFGGFGVDNFGGSLRTVGTVGNTDITVDDYYAAIREELNAWAAQTGSAPSMTSPEGERVAQSALGRLIAQKALENEAARLGLSVGDEYVRDQVVAMPAFQGIDGAFDREAYAFTLRQNGLTVAQYEANIRAAAATGLTASAVRTGITPPAGFVDALAAHLGERRDILWLKLDASALAEPVPAPGEAEIAARYEAAPDAYTAPELRRFTYAAVTPETMAGEIGADEAELRALYDQRADQFNSPERRLVERLVFADQAAAESAKAALDAGQTTFEDLVAERGLKLADVDLGDATRAALGAAGDAVFTLDAPGIAGPVETPLGPALFRVNDILPAQSTPFEEVRDDLAEEVNADRARREIAGLREDIEDSIAGGATLEELAGETAMELGRIDMAPDTAEGIAAYVAFRQAAAVAAADDIPEVIELEDGGLAVLRLDEVVPPTLRPLDEVRDRVAADWTRAETEARLLALAERIEAARAQGQSLLAQGHVAQAVQDLSRNRGPQGAPPELIETAFALDAGETASIPADGVVHLVEVTRITPEDPAAEASAALRAQIAFGLEADVQNDVLDLFLAAVRNEAGISLNQTAVDAVRSQFP